MEVGILVLIRRRTRVPKPERLKEPETPESPPGLEISRRSTGKPTKGSSYDFLAPARGQPTAILTAVSGPLQGQQFPVEKETFHIGVSPGSELCIAADDYVSKHHASLRYEKGSLLIFDRGSRNGTFINESLVPHTGRALSSGDRIRVGMSTFAVTRAEPRA